MTQKELLTLVTIQVQLTKLQKQIVNSSLHPREYEQMDATLSPIIRKLLDIIESNKNKQYDYKKTSE